jgi:hypothetical protein
MFITGRVKKLECWLLVSFSGLSNICEKGKKEPAQVKHHKGPHMVVNVILVLTETFARYSVN